MPEIVIRDPDPEWPEAFAGLGSLLRRHLGDVALRIDHIGSTAVPGLPAKNIIDIQVTVADLAHPRVDEAMGSIGAEERPRAVLDHEPPGLTIPEPQRTKRLWHLRDEIDANIHVRLEGAWNQRYALLCRDFLRTHPDTAAAYAEVKRQLARLFGDDADSYYAVKDPAFDLFMSVAEDWVEVSGWAPGRSDA
ncbi:MAG: GrpB family protein [Acidimicrobiia bacterium]|nr:GrpB family protein [Acidimicrobiia bacterium]